MNMMKMFGAGILMAAAMTSFGASAGEIDQTAARAIANDFVKQHAAMAGTFRAPATADIKLAHAEASKVEGNDYYVFNIAGGGWVIIAGDDRANHVLAYGDNGSIDMNNMPQSMKAYIGRYKTQIEALKAYKGETRPKAPKRVEAVEPLLKSVNWAQQGPFNYQCPVYNGETSSVGCAGLAMAQVVNYWKYPTEMPALASYPNSYNYSYVPSLPARTINWSLVRNQYAEWVDGKLGYVEGVTDDEKQEVAWLCRYCSQSCQMTFSPDGRGSNVLKQKNGFLSLGYSEDAKLLGIEAWPSRETWNTTDYTDEQWTAIMNEELAKGHPLPYSCEDWSLGHAFVVDGVDADGLYHVSWGWYGRGDGWFEHRAFNVTVQNEYMEFNDALFMIIDLIPYEGYVIPGDEQYPLGDMNFDGIVNVTDVTILINSLLNNQTDNPIENADMNNDGVTNITDVTLLIAQVLNQE